MITRPLLVPAALACAAALAPEASAATIATTRGCLNSQSPAQLVGTGFTPGATVAVSSGPLPTLKALAGPDGSFVLPFTAPLADPTSPPSTFAFTATDGVVGAQGASLLASPGIAVEPVGQTRLPQLYKLTGFEPGQKIYAHVRYAGKWRLRRTLGVAQGPCGTLDVKAKLLRKTAGKKVRSVFVQFDHLPAAKLDTHQLAFARFDVFPALRNYPERWINRRVGYRERTGL